MKKHLILSLVVCLILTACGAKDVEERSSEASESTTEPTTELTAEPTIEPTPEPTTEPTSTPMPIEIIEVTPEPTAEPVPVYEGYFTADELDNDPWPYYVLNNLINCAILKVINENDTVEILEQWPNFQTMCECCSMLVNGKSLSIIECDQNGNVRITAADYNEYLEKGTMIPENAYEYPEDAPIASDYPAAANTNQTSGDAMFTIPDCFPASFAEDSMYQDFVQTEWYAYPWVLEDATATDDYTYDALFYCDDYQLIVQYHEDYTFIGVTPKGEVGKKIWSKSSNTNNLHKPTYHP